ncbi:MAG: helix-turn-helix transcriptional regulator [Gammaproteobacteria bacterium]|nr:helix-turn-helix transcriptional regulator [Gammaproteobacteria bacterium]
MGAPSPAKLLIEARRRAGLTQRELARRAHTAQSVVARIESGTVSPTWGRLASLLRAAHHELQVGLVRTRTSRSRSHMLDDVPRILALTPEQRLIELRNASRLLAGAVLRGRPSV